MKKPEVRLAFSDFPGATNIDFILEILSTRYAIVLDDTRPDYLIYSVFGRRFLDFPKAVKICFIAENVRPDFSLCDYAFSFDWLEFGDRHFRAPNFILYPQWQDLLDRRSSRVSDLKAKPEFCNFVYANGNGHPIRNEFFHALNATKPVESFGRVLRNSARVIEAPYAGDWSQSKVEAQRSFRFSIAFENSEMPGYTTEKIVHALSADTVPIYWGDPDVGRVFNSERFIDVRALGVEKSIERVMNLEADHDAFLDMVNKPFFAEDALLDTMTRDALLDAFARIFDQPPESALRRDRFMWGPEYERVRSREVKLYQRLRFLSKLLPWR